MQTIFVTAGDSGSGSAYWMGRENGMRAAYAQTAGVSNSWTNTTVNLLGRQAYLSTLQGNPAVTLLFLRLPDGVYHCDANGQNCIEGWPRDNYQTLRKLWQGTMSTIQTVDGTATYARQELVDVLATELATYGADTVRTQDYAGTYSNLAGGDGDHWDHHSTAYFSQAAQASSTLVPHTLTGYRGRQIHGHSEHSMAPAAATDAYPQTSAPLQQRRSTQVVRSSCFTTTKRAATYGTPGCKTPRKP